MKTNIKYTVRRGFSVPIEITIGNGIALNDTAKVCLSVTVPKEVCKRDRSEDDHRPCVHICAALYNVEHEPDLIENGVAANHSGGYTGMCIDRSSLPTHQSIDPQICFDLIQINSGLDPVCTFLAHLLAEDASVDFTKCETPSYACVKLKLFKSQPSISIIHTVRNYWIPAMFRPNTRILIP